MFRWYDYWIKGIDNGVMDEPAVSVFVEGSREVVTGAQWPPKDVEYRSLYLRPRRKLSLEPEPMGAEYAAPGWLLPGPADRHRQGGDPQLEHRPVRAAHRDDRHRCRPHLRRDRPADTNFILRMWDDAPSGRRQLITTGYLKASHRELDDRTTEGNPYHPHTRAVPVEPGRSRSTSYACTRSRHVSKPGHRLVVELSNNEPLADEHNALLPPDAFHLPVGRPSRTRSTATPHTRRGSCCRSRRDRMGTAGIAQRRQPAAPTAATWSLHQVLAHRRIDGIGPIATT